MLNPIMRNLYQEHKIWRPPANVRDYDENDERPQGSRRVVSDSAASSVATSGESSTPPVLTPSDLDQGDPIEYEVDEWRQYPPFPSAYPATPQVKQRTINGAPSAKGRPTLDAVHEKPQPQRRPTGYTQPRERPIKPKAPNSQSLPSNSGRRRLHTDDEVVKVQDFGLSLERLRVSPT